MSEHLWFLSKIEETRIAFDDLPPDIASKLLDWCNAGHRPVANLQIFKTGKSNYFARLGFRTILWYQYIRRWM